MSMTTTDHHEIRKWAESHGGHPAAVKRTHRSGDVGIIRVMFPSSDRARDDHLEEISWDDFFAQFEESQLALVFDPNSLFNKLIGRDTAQQREQGGHGSRHHPDSRHEAGDKAASAGSDDLTAREYRDENGNVRHHTRSYMKSHPDA